jgi:glutathione S-transferase
MSTETVTSLRISRIIKADRETVFQAWTEPDQLKLWSCPEGMNVADSQVDLTVGGRYLLRMESPEGKVHTAVGVYREIESPSRLVYTWDWEEESIGETLVTVEFNDLGESTEVVLIHELFPNAEVKVGHDEGWTSCFKRLEKLFG